jgi:glutaredoxin
MFKKVEIYTKSNCSYCEMAKQYFDSQNIEYSLHDVENVETFNELLNRNPSARTMPQIFINDQLIGGYTDLIEWLKQ